MQSGAAGSPEAELAEIQRKLSQPDAFKKLGMAEMSRLSERMGKLMEAQMKDMNSPGWAEKAAEGAGRVRLPLARRSRSRRATATGSVSCGKTVGSNGPSS